MGTQLKSDNLNDAMTRLTEKGENNHGASHTGTSNGMKDGRHVSKRFLAGEPSWVNETNVFASSIYWQQGSRLRKGVNRGSTCCTDLCDKSERVTGPSKALWISSIKLVKYRTLIG